MAILDKIIGAATPPESPEKRMEARGKARAEAQQGDWLWLILDHHERLEAALDAVKTGGSAQARHQALREFERLFAGHSIAEEMVVYPAGMQEGEKLSMNMAYTEQTAAKQQIAALEVMDPMSQDFLDKLAHLEGAVLHHMHEEEDKRFVQLHQKAGPEENARITERYKEEFQNYMGDAAPRGDLHPHVPVEPRSFTAG